MTGDASREAPGSPGVLGYVLSVAVSLVAFGVAIAVLNRVQEGRWFDPGGLVVVVVVFGAIPAAVIGAFGAAAVHAICLHTAVQTWYVLTAGVVGFVVGLLLFRDPWFALALGSATTVGRLAVIPLALRRRRLSRPYDLEASSAR